eukprot:857892-Amphidinium_carterae.1
MNVAIVVALVAVAAAVEEGKDTIHIITTIASFRRSSTLQCGTSATSAEMALAHAPSSRVSKTSCVHVKQNGRLSEKCLEHGKC